MLGWRWPSRTRDRLSELRRWYEGAFGVPILDMPMPARGLVPFEDHIEGRRAIMVGTRIAAREPLLYGAEQVMRVADAPPGYFLAGYWAKGVNSHALYHCRVDAWSRVHLRIAFGGVYLDDRLLRRIILRFLESYFEYERRAERLGVKVESYHHMGIGQYQATWPDGMVCREPDDLSGEVQIDRDLVDRPFERLLAGGRRG